MEHLVENIKLKMQVFRLEELDSHWQTRNFDIPSRIIPFVRIYFPIEGEGFAIHSGKQYHLVPGKIYLIPPCAITEVSCPKRLVKYWGHFNANILDSSLDIFTVFHPIYELPVENHAFCVTLFESLVTAYYRDDQTPRKESTPLQRMEAASALTLLLMPFLRTINEGSEEATVGKMAQFGELLAYIEENIGQGLSLKELSGVAHFNPTYLSNLFAEKMGLSLIQYCNGRRINKAINLMWSTNHSISQIAYKVGANNVDAFSRLFKRHTGLSPAVFKKRIKSDSYSGK